MHGEEVIGTSFYVMEYLEGRVIWDSTSGPYAPEERARFWDSANDAMRNSIVWILNPWGLAILENMGITSLVN